MRPSTCPQLAMTSHAVLSTAAGASTICPLVRHSRALDISYVKTDACCAPLPPATPRQVTTRSALTGVKRNQKNSGPAPEGFQRVRFFLPITPDDGFGDAMSFFSVARRFKHEHPHLKVDLVFEAKRDLSIFSSRVFATKPNGTRPFYLDGVRVLLDPSREGEKKLPRDSVQVIRLAATTDLDFIDEALPHPPLAPLNIYLTEPGASQDILLPPQLSLNDVCRDRKSRLHAVMTAGLLDTDHGILIDDTELPKTPPVGDDKYREVLLLDLCTKHDIWLRDTLKNYAQARWGFAYYHDGNFLFQNRENGYFNRLKQALDSGEISSEGGIVIFDFSSSCSTRLQVLKDTSHPFTQVFYQGVINQGVEYPDVTIIRVGPVGHQLFLRFMQQSDLPVLVTGTRSLEEAIALKKPFYYDMAVWKRDLLQGMLQQAGTHLCTRDAVMVASALARFDIETGLTRWPALVSLYRQFKRLCKSKTAMTYEQTARWLSKRLDKGHDLGKAALFDDYKDIIVEAHLRSTDRSLSVREEIALLRALWIRECYLSGAEHKHTARLFYDEDCQQAMIRFAELIAGQPSITDSLYRSMQMYWR
ncbi:MAG: hypothetical protein HQM16_02230 [Deltaproteobacteria bacterium]|nr:hypothetical protein [Deltaproteobacteria bacterium]